MERVTIDDGTSWPDPTGKDFKNLMWRMCHAHDSLEASCFLQAVTVMEAYSYLVSEPTLTLEQARQKIRGIRKTLNERKKQNCSCASGQGGPCASCMESKHDL